MVNGTRIHGSVGADLNVISSSTPSLQWSAADSLPAVASASLCFRSASGAAAACPSFDESAAAFADAAASAPLADEFFLFMFSEPDMQGQQGLPCAVKFQSRNAGLVSDTSLRHSSGAAARTQPDSDFAEGCINVVFWKVSTRSQMSKF